MTTYLRTRRIVLRRFTTADADWLADLHGDPAVMRYIDVSPVPRQVVTGETLPVALVRHGFARLGLDRIVAMTMAVNLASRRVLEKADPDPDPHLARRLATAP